MEALRMATLSMTGQESAEAIVGAGPRQGQIGVWKRARRIEKPGGHPTEGPNMKKDGKEASGLRKEGRKREGENSNTLVLSARTFILFTLGCIGLNV